MVIIDDFKLLSNTFYDIAGIRTKTYLVFCYNIKKNDTIFSERYCIDNATNLFSKSFFILTPSVQTNFTL